MHKAIKAFVDDAPADAAAERKVNVEWKPFMIDPGVTPMGELFEDYAQRRWGSSAWTSGLKKTGRKDGANFDNFKWAANTLKAHQLIHYCKSNGISSTDRVNALLFQSEYERGENISLVDVLVGIAREALDEDGNSNNDDNNLDDLRRYLTEDEGKIEVQKEIAIGRKRYGITGVPYFIVSADEGGGNQRQRPYGFSGAQSPETFVELFEELSEE